MRRDALDNLALGQIAKRGKRAFDALQVEPAPPEADGTQPVGADSSTGSAERRFESGSRAATVACGWNGWRRGAGVHPSAAPSPAKGGGADGRPLSSALGPADLDLVRRQHLDLAIRPFEHEHCGVRVKVEPSALLVVRYTEDAAASRLHHYDGDVV